MLALETMSQNRWERKLVGSGSGFRSQFSRLKLRVKFWAQEAGSEYSPGRHLPDIPFITRLSALRLAVWQIWVARRSSDVTGEAPTDNAFWLMNSSEARVMLEWIIVI